MERKWGWKMAGNFKNVPGLLPPYKTARWRRKERIRTKRTDLFFLLAIPFCLPFSPPSFIPPSLLCCVVSFPPSDGRRRRQRRFPGDFMDLHSPHCRTHGDRVNMTSKVCAEKCVPPPGAENSQMLTAVVPETEWWSIYFVDVICVCSQTRSKQRTFAGWRRRRTSCQGEKEECASPCCPRSVVVSLAFMLRSTVTDYSALWTALDIDRKRELA